MSENKIKFEVQEAIPDHLRKSIISKFAYVDEAITAAEISEDGRQVILNLRNELDAVKQERLNSKIEFVVQEMTRGAMKPRTEILEDYRDRKTFCRHRAGSGRCQLPKKNVDRSFT